MRNLRAYNAVILAGLALDIKFFLHVLYE